MRNQQEVDVPYAAVSVMVFTTKRIKALAARLVIGG